MRWLVLVLLLFAVGCNVSDHEYAPVSGKVTLKGKPLAGAAVVFQPRAQGNVQDTGQTSFATTDAEGRFTLRTNKDQMEGAIVGEHVVMISTSTGGDPEDDTVRASKEILPQEYWDGSKKFSVPPGGTSTANFDL